MASKTWAQYNPQKKLQIQVWLVKKFQMQCKFICIDNISNPTSNNIFTIQNIAKQKLLPHCGVGGLTQLSHVIRFYLSVISETTFIAFHIFYFYVFPPPHPESYYYIISVYPHNKCVLLNSTLFVMVTDLKNLKNKQYKHYCNEEHMQRTVFT